MRQNTPVVAVLLAALVLGAGVASLASLGAGEPGPEDVAIRVGGVEVTYAEYEMRTVAALATKSVVDRVIAGEDFGMPIESVEQMRMVYTVFEPLQAELNQDVGLVASVVAPAAAYAVAIDAGAAPSDEAIAERMELTSRFQEIIRTGTEGTLGFPRALQEAQAAALGEERYREAYLRLQARDALAGERLVDHVDLSPAEVGVMPFVMAMRAAEDVDLWIHPSLGVTVEEVRTELDRQARYQLALIALTEELQGDFED